MLKTIAFHISSLVDGGAERVICNLANNFSQKGYKVYMITSKMEDRQYHKLDEKVTRIVMPEPDGGRIANAIHRVTILRDTIRQTGAEAVVSFIGKTNLRTVMATRFLPTKAIVSVRSAPTREYAGKFQQFLARFLFRQAEGVVFQTEMAQQFFSKSVQKKSAILMNPLLGDFSRERYAGERTPEIVTVGRLHSVKNHEMLIRAFAQIAEDYPELVLRIYGDGEHRDKLEKLIQELHLEQKAFLMGQCDKVADTIYQSAIFALTSNTEGMPNALLEAMALGLPVISTDCPCGGPAMLIQNGVNGILIPVGDEKALAEEMRKLLDDPAYADQLGREASKVRQQYAPEKIYRMWEEYITRVAG